MYCTMANNRNAAWNIMMYIIGVILNQGGVKWNDEARGLVRKMRLLKFKPLSPRTHTGIWVTKLHQAHPDWIWARKHIDSCPVCQEKARLLRHGVLFIKFYLKTREFTELYLGKFYGLPEFSNALKRMEERLKKSQEKNKVQELKPRISRCTFFADHLKKLTPEEAIVSTKKHINSNGKKRVCFDCVAALNEHLAKEEEVAA